MKKQNEQVTNAINAMDFEILKERWVITMEELWDNLAEEDKVEIHNKYCAEYTKYDDEILSIDELEEQLNDYKGLEVLDVLDDDFDKSETYFQCDGYGNWHSSNDAEDFLLSEEDYFGYIWEYDSSTLQEYEDMFKEELENALLEFAKANNLPQSKVYYWMEEELWNEHITEDWDSIAERFAEFVLTEDEE